MDGLVPPGTWVAVRKVILTAGERAPWLPPETASVPLVAIVKGFLEHPGRLGEMVRVRTAAGRSVEGELREVNPAYRHGFGELVPEILTAGREARHKYMDGAGRRD